MAVTVMQLCLRNGSSTVYLVKNFSVGLHCSDFASHHDSLSSFLCNQPTGGKELYNDNIIMVYAWTVHVKYIFKVWFLFTQAQCRVLVV